MAASSVAHDSSTRLLDPLWTQQIGGLMVILERPPAHLTSRNQQLANNEVPKCSSFARNAARPRKCLVGEGSSSEGRHQEQELLWRQFFLDPTLWWDNRQYRRSFQSPAFLQKGSSEVLWLNHFYKPSRVDEELAAVDVQMGRGIPTSLPVVPEHGRPAGCEMGFTAVTVNKVCVPGKVIEAVEALEGLAQTDSPISTSLFYAVLKQCVAQKDLLLGRRVHALTVKMGYESDTFLGFHMLRMYASHGRLQDAMDVFEAIVEPDAFTWSAIITVHVKHGQDKQGIQLYHRMRRSSVRPDGHVFVAALQACARGSDLKTGQQVHADVLASGVEPDLYVVNCLVDMYAKCGSVKDAQRLFDRLRQKDVVTWNAMIAGYSQQGMSQEALDLYNEMKKEGMVAPSSVTFVCLLQACANVGISAMEKGRTLHLQIREQGYQADVFVASSLVNMYAKCGSLEDAQKVFDGLGQKDVVTWTAMIAAYSQQGMGQEALSLYSAMQEERMAVPNSVTFACLLHACASVGTPALEKGKRLHLQIRERGYQNDVFVASSLLNMYAKCGSLEDAQRVFDGLGQKDVVTWNAMIAGYSQQGMGQEALSLYSVMQEEGITVPDSLTFLSLLQACASLGTTALEKGKQLHGEIEERGLQSDVVGNGLVNMYVKCGSLEDAQSLFDRLPQKDVVTWNAMIAGYSQQGMGQEGLHLYSAMQGEGIAGADSVTFACLLQSCASVAALPLGKQLHGQIEERGLQGDLVLGTSLVNMYAKCGSIVDAQLVFDALPERDIVAWNALIAGYTRQGDSEVVFDLVHRMREDCKQPNAITFLSVLTVCSHAGLVNKGQEYFDVMSRKYGITPTLDHYTCMVDLLGRAGQLYEALELVRTMPVQPNDVVWSTLLGACRKWRNVEVGRYAFDQAVKLDEKDAAAYVVMSNIYTGAQMWNEAQEIQARRQKVGA